MTVTIPLDTAKSEKYYALPRHDMFGQLPRPLGRVLDVGCGEGGSAPFLRQAGATWLSGIEIMPEQAEAARAILDEICADDALTCAAQVTGPFDTILCYDVLEHIFDPLPVLQALREIAAPGGRLHVSVPNASHVSLLYDLIVRGTFGYTPFGHRDVTHVRWFTRRDILALIGEAGWTITNVQPSTLHWRSRTLAALTRGWSTEFFAGQWHVLAVRPVIAVCVPVYRAHGAPNAASQAGQLSVALDGRPGELVIALNGLTAEAAGVGSTSPALSGEGRVRTVELGVNRGVAPGWNAAAAASEADTLVFANDDVSFGAGSLARLEQALADHPEAGIVGPVGSRFDFATGAHVAWVSTEGRPPGQIVAADVVSGFLFAVRRTDFEAVGGFDEAYAPAIMEEIDLTLAITLDRGLGVYAVAGIEHGHEYGVSSAPPWRRIAHNGKREFLFRIHRRNRRHFYAKWADRL